MLQRLLEPSQRSPQFSIIQPCAVGIELCQTNDNTWPNLAEELLSGACGSTEVEMDRSVVPSSVGWVFSGLITVAPLREYPCQLCTVDHKNLAP